MKRLVAFTLPFIIATAIHASTPTRFDLRLVAFGHPPLAAVKSTLEQPSYAPVFFMDEPLRFAVQRGGSPAGAQWWKDVRITVKDVNGTVRVDRADAVRLTEERLNGDLVAGSPTNFLGGWSRDRTYIRFELAPLPPGDFVATAQMPLAGGGVLETDRVLFHVRSGDEDRDVKRLYLRVRADRTSTYEEYKKIMLELLAMQPDDSGILELIADRSLNIAPPAETLQWYRRAREARTAGIERRKAERGDRLTKEECEAMETSMLNVSLFEKVYDDYRAHQHERQLIILGSSGDRKLYAWRRADGAIIGIVDLRDPSRVRPIESKNVPPPAKRQ